MFPYIKIFNKTITSYTILVIIGILLVGFLCIRRCKKYNINDNNMIIFLLIASIGIIIWYCKLQINYRFNNQY